MIHGNNLRVSLDLGGPTSNLWTLSPEYTSLFSTTAGNQVQIINILHWGSYNDLPVDLPLPSPNLSKHGECVLWNAALIIPFPYLNTLWGAKLHLRQNLSIPERSYIWQMCHGQSSNLVFGSRHMNHAKLQLANLLENQLETSLSSVCLEEQTSCE